MTILGYSSFDWLPSALYLLLLITLSVRPRNRPETKPFIFLVQGLIFLILLVHGAVLHDSIFTPQGFVFGFAQNLSLIAWVGLAFYWVQSWMLPISSMRLMALALAMVCAILPDVFPGTLLSARTVSDAWFKGHFIVATSAVGLLSLAVMHAILMSIQDRALRRQFTYTQDSRIGHWLESLPPLMAMESLLFSFIYVGFALLSLTVFSGLFFSQALFGRPLVFDHKTIFALISWFLFAGLIVARWRVGLRGLVAIRWVLGAYVALILAYVGSRFVLEVILQRT